MMELPDPIEMMEDRAERMKDLYYDGLWHCYNCGEPIQPGHEETLSPDPASPVVCGKCLRKYYKV